MSEPENNSSTSAYNSAYAQTVAPSQGATQQQPQAATTAPAATGVSPAAVPVYSTAPKKSHGWIVGIVVVVCVFLLMAISLVSCTSMTSSLFAGAAFSSYDDPAAELMEPSIGVIELNGTIQYDGSACSPEGLKSLLESAEANPNIEGVLLKVNSGGGVATAGEEMAELVRDFSKPIVVSSQATNASAAYEISSQADHIFVDKTTAIGSIGVIMQVTDLSGLYDKLGISIENIKSADAKDAGGGTRPLTDEERRWYQDIVDQINEVFIETVAEGRDMSISDVKKLANGLPYTGMDAVDNGLADEIGSADDAVEYLSELLGYHQPMNTVSLMPRSSDLADILDLLGESDVDIDAEDIQRALNGIDGRRVVQ